MSKRKIKLDLPIHTLSFACSSFITILWTSKSTAGTSMDTDSAYIAISGKTLEEVIKPYMLEKYKFGLLDRGELAISLVSTHMLHWFSYFYCKRKVLDDGIHTVPLDINLCPIKSQEEEVVGGRELSEMLATNFED
ncbi:hypothetical protein MAR_021238 [Mya arenaria]|uniref:Uncharacterized protein n=1 Tax=Mya arenaria TaxID=6604 RepID=A0ABY7EBS4_MYAAR|nr:hypothetical protein MAR_021238 [Mya arenaria]